MQNARYAVLTHAIVTTRPALINVSDHAVLHPQLDRRAAVRAYLHQLRARAARALVAARRGEVRLRVGEADDARRLPTDGRLGHVGTARVEGGLREGHRREWLHW